VFIFYRRHFIFIMQRTLVHIWRELNETFWTCFHKPSGVCPFFRRPGVYFPKTKEMHDIVIHVDACPGRCGDPLGNLESLAVSSSSSNGKYWTRKP
jgi:hypothetical protein